MSYKNWKLMEKIDVAVRTGGNYGFTGYIVEHGDKDALEKAKDWAKSREYDYDKKEWTNTLEPEVYTFENRDFTVKILNSAGGSSQGGRLSFWRCEVEKDGVKFTIGVNDAILADLIKNSDLSRGVVTEKVMFARKAGQPGLIHEGMDAYVEATADMKHKANMKSMSKTNKWEIGGVYSTITQSDVCLGEVWDNYEEYVEQTDSGWYGRKEKKLRLRTKPVKAKVWISRDDGKTLTEMLKEKVSSSYSWMDARKPPARAKTEQLEVTDEDLELIDKLLKNKTDYLREYGGGVIKGRYVRELK